MKVADFILSALRDQGVSHCFIDLGGLNDNFMPPLTGTKGLRTIVAAFEGGAAYMADGYARRRLADMTPLPPCSSAGRALAP
jgi:acetolactate synthase-1/2/3 large subunit